MTLLNFSMLIGLGGAVVPLVLHLLSRARYRSIDWGAMMFLEGVDVRQRQATKIKQLILLAMRMAIVGMLAFALARPIVKGAGWGALAGEGRMTAVIILDRSASMGYDENGKSRLDLAREALNGVFSNIHKGDQVSLILTGDGQVTDNIQPSSDLQAVWDRVRDINVSYSRADMKEALLRAADVFENNKVNRELYVICDKQASSWKEIDSAFQAAWDQRLNRSQQPLRMFIVPVGSTDADNVAISSVELVNPPAIKSSSAEIEVQIRNFGTIPRTAMPLKVMAGNTEILNTTVNIAPDQTTSVRAPVKFPDSGSQIVSASVKSTGLTGDDRKDEVIDVVEPVKVLIVSGDERPGTFRSESDFMHLALAPYEMVKRTGPDPATVTILPADKWIDQDLKTYQVVVLANLSQFTASQSQALEQFVYGGGGLLIAPGNLSRVDNYNAMLYRDGVGILPAMLSPATSSDGSSVTGLLGIDLTHPIFKFLKGRPDPVPAATVGRYFPAQTRPTDARVLAHYVSGQPFLTEVSLGRGRVLLMTTPLDADWSNLPIYPFYLPFAQSAIRYLAAGTLSDRNLQPGQPLNFTFEETMDTKTASITLPDGHKEETEIITPPGQRSEVRYAKTSQPGQYILNYTIATKPKQLHFVVQTPTEESDLTPLSTERMSTLATALGAQWIDTNKTTISSELSEAREGRELWLRLLAIVFVLSIVELMLARKWSYEETG